MSLLRLEDLSVARGGRTVVREVSIDIPSGEVTALLGPNGAGKSALVLAVGGVLRPTGGAHARPSPRSATSPVGARSRSARRASRSWPKAGGCCPS